MFSKILQFSNVLILTSSSNAIALLSSKALNVDNPLGLSKPVAAFKALGLSIRLVLWVNRGGLIATSEAVGEGVGVQLVQQGGTAQRWVPLLRKP